MVSERRTLIGWRGGDGRYKLTLALSEGKAAKRSLLLDWSALSCAFFILAAILFGA